MTLISYTKINDGETIDAADVNTPLDIIYDDYNGNIDSNNLKNSAVTSAKLADGAVTNAKLNTTIGEIGGAWVNYTPTWTNLTLGNGVLGYAKYSRIGKTVQWFVSFTFGSTTSVTGNVSVSLPVNPGVGFTSSVPIALATYVEAGVNAYPGYIGGQGALYAHNSANTHTIRVSVNASVPFTWGEGDIIILNGTYEAA